MNIKPGQVLKALLIGLPILFLCMVTFRVVVAEADVVYPNPDTESVFLKSHTLANAIVPGIPLYSGSSGPDFAGHGCASHQREFQFWFAIPSTGERAVMPAVRRDIGSRLRGRGSQITAASGNQVKGFQYDYAAGHTRGSVIIDPLVIADSSSAAD